MDGSTAIPQATFFRMLARLIPTREPRAMPWDAIPWRPRIHLGLFVHRVDGLSPGLYALPRDPDKIEVLKGVMRPGFRWQRVPACPPGLPLYLLQEGDCRALAARVSCGQDIAGDGAFSLGMIADYRDSLTTYGAGVLPESLLGGRHGGAGALPRGRRGGHSVHGDRLLLRRSGPRGPSGSTRWSGRASTTSRWVARSRTCA